MDEAGHQSVADVLREKSGLAPRVEAELRRRDAVPLWLEAADRVRNDWLDELHRNVTRKGWPEELRGAMTGALLLTKAGIIGAAAAMPNTPGGAIAMSASVPVELDHFLHTVMSPLQTPESDDPKAPMIFNPAKQSQAAEEIGRLAGMQAETGYPLLRQTEFRWSPSVLLGTRFIYYHELFHILLRTLGDDQMVPAEWLRPEEEYIADELRADQWAFGMLTLELKSVPGVWPAAFAGMALAVSLAAVREFACHVGEGGKRSTKNSTHRMGRLRYWARLAEGRLGPAPGAGAIGAYIWDATGKLLRLVHTVPSPAFSLIHQTADRPARDWPAASTRLLQWCALGDVRRVGASLGCILASALESAAEYERAKRAVEVVSYIVSDLAPLEPELGLQRSMPDSAPGPRRRGAPSCTSR